MVFNGTCAVRDRDRKTVLIEGMGKGRGGGSDMKIGLIAKRENRQKSPASLKF